MNHIFIDINHLKELREWVGYQIQDHQKAMSEGVNTELNRGARYAFDIIGWRLDGLIHGAEDASQLGTVRDVREALGLSGGEEESTEGMTEKQLDIFTDMVRDLQKMASDNSVNESISEESRAAYTAKEDAFATVLLVLKTCMANKL